MTLAELENQLTAHRIELRITGGRLRYHAPAPFPREILEGLREHKPALLRHLKSSQASASDDEKMQGKKSTRVDEVLSQDNKAPADKKNCAGAHLLGAAPNETRVSQTEVEPNLQRVANTEAPPNYKRVGNSPYVGRMSSRDDTILEAMRARLPELDGRPLVVCGYSHPDIGKVLRDYIGHIDDTREGRDTTLYTSFYMELVRGVAETLEAQS